jgi:cytochrome c1
MSALDALRRADPARSLPPHALDDRDERLLREILGEQPEASGEVSRGLPAAPRRRSGWEWRPALVTAVVAAAVVTGSVVAIRAVSIPPTTASPATAPRSALEDAVYARLAEVATGDIPLRQKSAMTWTDQLPHGDGDGGIDLTGKDLYIAAACDGGGAIAIRESGRSPVGLRCDGRAAVGPIDLSADSTGRLRSAEMTVDVTAGHPRYVAKAMAFATAPAIPSQSPDASADPAARAKAAAWLAGALVPPGATRVRTPPSGTTIDSENQDWWCRPMAEADAYWTVSGMDLPQVSDWLRAHPSNGLKNIGPASLPADPAVTNDAVHDFASASAFEGMTFELASWGHGTVIHLQVGVLGTDSVCATPPPGTQLGTAGG